MKADQDGKYRWVYELDMMKNPVIFNVVFKVLLGVFIGVWAFVLILSIIENGFDAEELMMMTRIFFIIVIGILVLSFLSYLIYAKMIGGKYCVIFEMDDTGILHLQLDRQADVGKAIALMSALVNLESRNFGAASAGLAVSVNQDIYTEFAKVRNIRILRRNNTIKVNEILMKNQVYAADEDFDFVLNYIIDHCPQARIYE